MRVLVHNIHQGGRTLPGTGRAGYSILEPIRIPPTDSFGMGDFVAGAFTLPQTPVAVRRAGVGDFVPGHYAVPQNPIRDAQGMSGCGCGSGCGGGCGMGAIDLSFSGTGIASSVMAGSTIPNYWIYLAGGALILLPLMSGRRRRR
jgi:hypothetical protein